LLLLLLLFYLLLSEHIAQSRRSVRERWSLRRLYS